MKAVYLFVLVCHIHAQAEVLEGHLKQLGLQRESEGHIEIRNDVPNVETFFEKYIAGSTPVVLKGAAHNVPAFQKWTDQYIK